MDLGDQLKKLFPDHQSEEPDQKPTEANGLWISDEPLICRYEKRKGKPITIISGYDGNKQDFKDLTRQIQQLLGVGGSHKQEEIIIQGDYRDRIMDVLKDLGFKVKRVGG